MGQADLFTPWHRPATPVRVLQPALGRPQAKQEIIQDLLCSRASAMKHKAEGNGPTGAALSKQGQELCE